ncbi:transposable element Tcb2 transposase [Trichonephila clavipes]|nr:transposable element Tcb2 transposase [Trichonephila clavipes]
MEAGWSARRVVRQIDLSDCVVRRCCDQKIREMSFTRRPGSGRLRQTSRRKDRHIVINTHVQLTVPSATIQALGIPVSTRTIRRHLAERHLGSRCPLCVLPLTPTHRRPICSGAMQEETRLQQNGTRSSLATRDSRFNLSSDDNRVRVWGPQSDHLNSAFALQRHIAPKAGVMVCGTLTYNTWSLLVLIHGTMTAQGYAHDILYMYCHSCNGSQEPFFNKTMLGLIRQGCHKTVFTLLHPSLVCSIPRFGSNRAYMG